MGELLPISLLDEKVGDVGRRDAVPFEREVGGVDEFPGVVDVVECRVGVAGGPP